ncbi:uncharacterized protein LOC34622864 [Cyclospora cayetanensis]|uniref:Uncharacterized protein LOC34622864 n=1 Tax=Cyclospora cayetanensis TaxID=88456 RepID=A0A6P6RUM3_9EIME|nr:uncharacterized protein LOC34622864 [Cyclospora cayetanensis]
MTCTVWPSRLLAEDVPSGEGSQSCAGNPALHGVSPFGPAHVSSLVHLGCSRRSRDTEEALPGKEALKASAKLLPRLEPPASVDSGEEAPCRSSSWGAVDTRAFVVECGAGASLFMGVPERHRAWPASETCADVTTVEAPAGREFAARGAKRRSTSWASCDWQERSQHLVAATKSAEGFQGYGAVCSYVEAPTRVATCTVREADTCTCNEEQGTLKVPAKTRNTVSPDAVEGASSSNKMCTACSSSAAALVEGSFEEEESADVGSECLSEKAVMPSPCGAEEGDAESAESNGCLSCSDISATRFNSGGPHSELPCRGPSSSEASDASCSRTSVHCIDDSVPGAAQKIQNADSSAEHTRNSVVVWESLPDGDGERQPASAGSSGLDAANWGLIQRKELKRLQPTGFDNMAAAMVESCTDEPLNGLSGCPPVPELARDGEGGEAATQKEGSAALHALLVPTDTWAVDSEGLEKDLPLAFKGSSPVGKHITEASGTPVKKLGRLAALFDPKDRRKAVKQKSKRRQSGSLEGAERDGIVHVDPQEQSLGETKEGACALLMAMYPGAEEQCFTSNDEEDQCGGAKVLVDETSATPLTPFLIERQEKVSELLECSSLSSSVLLPDTEGRASHDGSRQISQNNQEDESDKQPLSSSQDCPSLWASFGSENLEDEEGGTSFQDAAEALEGDAVGGEAEHAGEGEAERAVGGEAEYAVEGEAEHAGEGEAEHAGELLASSSCQVGQEPQEGQSSDGGPLKTYLHEASPAWGLLYCTTEASEDPENFQEVGEVEDGKPVESQGNEMRGYSSEIFRTAEAACQKGQSHEARQSSDYGLSLVDSCGNSAAEPEGGPSCLLDGSDVGGGKNVELPGQSFRKSSRQSSLYEAQEAPNCESSYHCRESNLHVVASRCVLGDSRAQLHENGAVRFQDASEIVDRKASLDTTHEGQPFSQCGICQSFSRCGEGGKRQELLQAVLQEPLTRWHLRESGEPSTAALKTLQNTAASESTEVERCSCCSGPPTADMVQLKQGPESSQRSHTPSIPLESYHDAAEGAHGEVPESTRAEGRASHDGSRQISQNNQEDESDKLPLSSSQDCPSLWASFGSENLEDEEGGNSFQDAAEALEGDAVGGEAEHAGDGEAEHAGELLTSSSCQVGQEPQEGQSSDGGPLKTWLHGDMSIWEFRGSFTHSAGVEHASLEANQKDVEARAAVESGEEVSCGGSSSSEKTEQAKGPQGCETQTSWQSGMHGENLSLWSLDGRASVACSGFRRCVDDGKAVTLEGEAGEQTSRVASRQSSHERQGTLVSKDCIQLVEEKLGVFEVGAEDQKPTRSETLSSALDKAPAEASEPRGPTEAAMEVGGLRSCSVPEADAAYRRCIIAHLSLSEGSLSTLHINLHASQGDTATFRLTQGEAEAYSEPSTPRQVPMAAPLSNPRCLLPGDSRDCFCGGQMGCRWRSRVRRPLGRLPQGSRIQVKASVGSSRQRSHGDWVSATVQRESAPREAAEPVFPAGAAQVPAAQSAKTMGGTDASHEKVAEANRPQRSSWDAEARRSPNVEANLHPPTALRSSGNQPSLAGMQLDGTLPPVHPPGHMHDQQTAPALGGQMPAEGGPPVVVVDGGGMQTGICGTELSNASRTSSSERAPAIAGVEDTRESIESDGSGREPLSHSCNESSSAGDARQQSHRDSGTGRSARPSRSSSLNESDTSSSSEDSERRRSSNASDTSSSSDSTTGNREFLAENRVSDSRARNASGGYQRWSSPGELQTAAHDAVPCTALVDGRENPCDAGSYSLPFVSVSSEGTPEGTSQSESRRMSPGGESEPVRDEALEHKPEQPPTMAQGAPARAADEAGARAQPHTPHASEVPVPFAASSESLKGLVASRQSSVSAAEHPPVVRRSATSAFGFAEAFSSLAKMVFASRAPSRAVTHEAARREESHTGAGHESVEREERPADGGFSTVAAGGKPTSTPGPAVQPLPLSSASVPRSAKSERPTPAFALTRAVSEMTGSHGKHHREASPGTEAEGPRQISEDCLNVLKQRPLQTQDDKGTRSAAKRYSSLTADPALREGAEGSPDHAGGRDQRYEFLENAVAFHTQPSGGFSDAIEEHLTGGVSSSKTSHDTSDGSEVGSAPCEHLQPNLKGPPIRGTKVLGGMHGHGEAGDQSPSSVHASEGAAPTKQPFDVSKSAERFWRSTDFRNAASGMVGELRPCGGGRASADRAAQQIERDFSPSRSSESESKSPSDSELSGESSNQDSLEWAARMGKRSSPKAWRLAWPQGLEFSSQGSESPGGLASPRQHKASASLRMASDVPVDRSVGYPPWHQENDWDLGRRSVSGPVPRAFQAAADRKVTRKGGAWTPRLPFEASKAAAYGQRGGSSEGDVEASEAVLPPPRTAAAARHQTSLDLGTTNSIVESAIQLAIHKSAPRQDIRRRGRRLLRDEKMDLIFEEFGWGAFSHSPALAEGALGSTKGGFLESRSALSECATKGTLAKRIAPPPASLACSLPPIFCGNALSDSSLWNLQLRRRSPGGRALLTRANSCAILEEDLARRPVRQTGQRGLPQAKTLRFASRTPVLGGASVLQQTGKPLQQASLSSLLQELLDAPDTRLGKAAGKPTVCATIRGVASRAGRREVGRLRASTMPKPRRPWACGEPISSPSAETNSAFRTYVHKPGCRCPLCSVGWISKRALGTNGTVPREYNGEALAPCEISTPRLQGGLPVVPLPPGGYAAASPIRIGSSPIGPHLGYGVCGVGTPSYQPQVRMPHGLRATAMTNATGYYDPTADGYHHHGTAMQGGAFSPRQEPRSPRVQTATSGEWPPLHESPNRGRLTVPAFVGYPAAQEDTQVDDKHSYGTPAFATSPPPDSESQERMQSKERPSVSLSRCVSSEELEKIKQQQQQQQQEQEELKRRQEELELEQSKQREELEAERQRLREQREALERQKKDFEQEKQDILQARLETVASSHRKACGGSNAELPVCSTERLPVGSDFDLPRNAAAHRPLRHTISTSNIVRSITGSGLGDMHSEIRHAGVGLEGEGLEKEGWSTVGGRQHNLSHPGHSHRFFSRTASIDTVEDKDTTASPQEELHTDPAMALSTALDKVAKIRMKLDTLQQQLEVQSHEVASYYSSLKTADQVHSSLQQTAADCRVCYGRRHTQMQEVEKRLSVLTAQDLQPCSIEELEELAQELEGTQYKLTVVQAQRAGGSSEDNRKKTKQLLPYSSSCLPDPKSSFAIPEEPVARIGPDDCVAMQESAMQEIKALGEDLEHIKTVHFQYKKAYKRLQGIMTQQVNSYDVDLQRLVAIEKNLEDKLRRLLFLNGDANYSELSDAQMQEYFRVVNLSIRKVYREIALRESNDRRQNEPRASGFIHYMANVCDGDCWNVLACAAPIRGVQCFESKSCESSHEDQDHAPINIPLWNSEENHVTLLAFPAKSGNRRVPRDSSREQSGSLSRVCSSVHIPFVAGSKTTSLVAQRMIAQRGRFTHHRMSG